MFCWVVFRISADVTPSNTAAVAEIGLLDGSGSMRDVARRYLSAQKTLPRAGATPPFHKLIMLSQQAGAFGSQLERPRILVRLAEPERCAGQQASGVGQQ